MTHKPSYTIKRTKDFEDDGTTLGDILRNALKPKPKTKKTERKQYPYSRYFKHEMSNWAG